MVVWICREEATLAALQGLVRTLEGDNGLRYATIRILTVNESRGIEIPAGSRGPDGRPLGPHVFTEPFSVATDPQVRSDAPIVAG